MKKLLEMLLRRCTVSVEQLDDAGVLAEYVELMGMKYLGQGRSTYQIQDINAPGKPVLEYEAWTLMRLTEKQAARFVHGPVGCDLPPWPPKHQHTWYTMDTLNHGIPITIKNVAQKCSDLEHCGYEIVNVLPLAAARGGAKTYTILYKMDEGQE
jgi:hypothetical protein